ncbi:hypothetical protein BD410DRAFT_813168 [Rickenella mellea]|uniref:Uncharacterized protein n=1 Tax=Rickenella mellea TaxID=50990 RepID=A0A4Y7QH87_9AGAM|nr:hypothetical protein BD410DRAFT_813168 [Rickenella mellea]
MGNLIWHDWARFVSITASVYAVWAGYWGIFYRKFFWDFVGGIVRDPGGLQAPASAALFINVIVKIPLIQIFVMLHALFVLALEWPLPLMKNLSIYRSIVVRIVLLVSQASIAILFYQARFLSHVRLPRSYETALSSGDLLFFPSTVHKHVESDIEFEIRLCPALQKKPKLPTPHFEPSVPAGDGGNRKKDDPFAPPYIPALFVGELRDDEEGDEYVVLLNKYSVVPSHFLLVTKELKSQASPLFPCDLVQTYLLLLAARKAGQSFFAFYNCGDRSGASQHHKHVQFIPTENGDGPPIETLARSKRLESDDKAFSLTQLPYANHIRRVPSFTLSTNRSTLEETLSQTFMMLLDLVISTVRHDPTHPPGPPSYNVILTLEHMHLIPRKCDEHVLKETGERLGVNALGYTGMLLVKSERELEAVKREGVLGILSAVGLPNVHEKQIRTKAWEVDEHGISCM